MRFDLHVRQGVRDQLTQLADRMSKWEQQPPLDANIRRRLVESIHDFPHTTAVAALSVAGVDGSGDFPALSYADAFVYVSVATGVAYEADPVVGLREVAPEPQPVVDFTWLTSNETQRTEALLEAFARMAGAPVDEVLSTSDYRRLKPGGAHDTMATIKSRFILPPAHDAGNLGIQLRSTAELGAAMRMLDRLESGALLLMDGTLSLPLVAREGSSLFFEHLKRLCCVRAREKGITFVALSKSHGLRGGELIEDAAREALGVAQGIPEHWYLRLPERASDGWELPAEDGRRLPPPGAVSYIVRFHRKTPVMRVDLDRVYWERAVQSQSREKTIEHERGLFAKLDYVGHDQRSYGYPYPIKSAHDRASLTEAERVALRKQVIDAALAVGMRPGLFRDASRATGHG